MGIVDNEGQGYLQKADKQVPEDRDYRGSCRVGGKRYWISGYKRPKPDGGTYLKLLLVPRD